MGTPEKSEARIALAAFVEAMSDIVSVVGAENLGEEAPLKPASYRIQAYEVSEEELAGYEMPPTKVAWPVDAGVSLAAASDCAVVAADKVAAVFDTATQLTFFTEGDKIYQVAAVAKLPGDVC
jgi:hypothetical protein